MANLFSLLGFGLPYARCPAYAVTITVNSVVNSCCSFIIMPYLLVVIYCLRFLYTPSNNPPTMVSILWGDYMDTCFSTEEPSLLSLAEVH